LSTATRLTHRALNLSLSNRCHVDCWMFLKLVMMMLTVYSISILTQTHSLKHACLRHPSQLQLLEMSDQLPLTVQFHPTTTVFGGNVFHSVRFPACVQNADKAIEMLGGMQQIASVLNNNVQNTQNTSTASN